MQEQEITRYTLYLTLNMILKPLAAEAPSKEIRDTLERHPDWLLEYDGTVPRFVLIASAINTLQRALEHGEWPIGKPEFTPIKPQEDNSIH